MRVVKEIFIMCLLCLAIVITLGILFYEYIPTSQNLPKPVKYEKDENITEILQETENSTNTQVVLRSYNINQEDLDLYKRQDDYDPGKTNPFAAYSAQSSNEGTGENSSSGVGSGSASNGGSGSSNSGSSNDSTGSFFEKPGSK